MNSKIGTVHVLWCDIKMNLLWVRVGSWLNYICIYIHIHTDTYMIESLIAGSKTYLKVLAFSRLWAHLIPTVTLGDSRHILVISQKSKLRLRDWVTCRRPLNFWVSGLGCEPRVENPKVLFLPLVVLFPPGLCKWYLLYYYSLIWGRTTMDKSQMRIVNGWLVTEWFMDLCLLTELWNEW